MLHFLYEILSGDKLGEGRDKINANFETIRLHINGMGSSVPPIFEESIVISSLEEGQVFTDELQIPHNRLYGLFVGTEGLAPGQSATVEFLGDAEEVQYIAVFTDELPEDDAQAWRYRDMLEENVMRIRVENTGFATINMTLTIRAEPF